MEGHSPEIDIPQHEEKTDAGFSEKRAARIVEGKQQDNSQLKKRKPLPPTSQAVLNRAARMQQRSMKEKILDAHKKNADELIALIKSLNALAKDSLQHEEQLMMQIRARHKLQEELLNALALETQGQLKEETLPKEVVDLIK